MLGERKTTPTWKLHKCTQIKNLNHLFDPAEIPPPPPSFVAPIAIPTIYSGLQKEFVSRLDCEEKNS